MKTYRKRMKYIKGIFPSARQINKIVWLSVGLTILVLFLASWIGPMVQNYRYTRSAASLRTDEIVSNLQNMRTILRAAVYWYAEGIARTKLDVKRRHSGWRSDYTIDDDSISSLVIMSRDKFDVKQYVKDTCKANRLADGYRSTIASDAEHARAGDYMITVLNDGQALYVGYKLGAHYHNDELDDKVRHYLTGRAKSHQLLGSDGVAAYRNDDEVYMLVCYLSDRHITAAYTAEAEAVITNMHSIRDAFMSWYAEHRETSGTPESIAEKFCGDVPDFKGMERLNVIPRRKDIRAHDYIIAYVEERKAFYVGYRFANTHDDYMVREKFITLAGSDRIVKADGVTPYRIRDFEAYMFMQNL